MNIKKALVILGLSVAPLSVNATVLDLIGGTPDVIPSNWNDINHHLDPNVGDDITVFTGTQLESGDGVWLTDPAEVVFEYLGSEAGNNNFSFSWDEFGIDGLFDNQFNTAGDSYISNQDSGFLNFGFVTDGRFTEEGAILTDSPLGDGGFATSDAFSIAVFRETSTSLILMFGDGFGDADFDDMIVRAPCFTSTRSGSTSNVRFRISRFCVY